MNTANLQTKIAGSTSALAFISAMALFLIQPVIGEILTPAWGGTPTVWLACLLFFQTVLTLGYFLAWGGTFYYPRVSFLIYCCILLLGLFFLIINPPHLEPEIFWTKSLPTSMGVLGYLSTHLFIIILGLSATSTLAHHVLGQINTNETTHLYSYSNAGSFIALISFPFLIEPYTSRSQQIQIFTLFVLSQTALSLYILILKSNISKSFLKYQPKPNTLTSNTDIKWWLILPICSSALLCGVTNHISTEIASVPFFWITPLALYLLSYVIAFGNFSTNYIPILERYTPVLVVLLFFFLSLSGLELSSGAIIVPLFIHLSCFFALCILLHHLLHEKRPKHESQNNPSLGAYYATISFGGLLGTLLTTLAFPWLFARIGIWEYPAAIATGIFLLGCSKNTGRPTLTELGMPAIFLLLLFLFRLAQGPLDFTVSPTWAATVSGSLYFGCLALAKDGRILGTSLAVVFLGLGYFLLSPENQIEIHRNEFGMLKIAKTLKNGHAQTLLYHGNTIHGIQSDNQKDTQGRFVPLSYYGPDGPAGDAFLKLQKTHPDGLKIGIIGLGAGSMAWFGKPNDHLEFFELDPAVGEIAENPAHFKYLKECLSKYNIVFGDGRRMLTSNKNYYDLLVLDAFSSDTVPIHLLTREAVETYLAHLGKNGSILCHISNRHFDLVRLMKGWEKISGITCFLFDNRDIGPQRIAQGFSPSQWVIFSKDANLKKSLDKDTRWKKLPEDIEPTILTDDHHSILGLLKW